MSYVVRYKLAIGAVGIVAVSFVAAMAHAAIDSQVLISGQSKTISTEYQIGDVAVADPRICDYVVGRERTSIYINAKDGGETTITLWDAKGLKREEFLVRVVSTTLKEMLSEIEGQFGNIRGLDVGIEQGRIEIGGQILDPEDYRRIAELAAKNPSVKNRTHMSEKVMSAIASTIRKHCDVPGVFVGVVKDKVMLTGVVYSSADRKRAVEVAKLYYPEIIDLLEVKESGRRVGDGELIELVFHMMEVKKGALKQMGVSWAPGSFPSGAGGASDGGSGMFSQVGDFGKSILGFVLQLAPKLRMINERGDGRVIENPSIIVKSGEKAEIFSGTEVPYYQGEDVRFKKVGIDISAEPVVVKGGVDIKLSATLSSPSGDLRGAVDTNTVSTTAVCPYGQSIVIGNIVRRGDVKVKNRFPQGIDSTSALFTLFLSKDFQSNKSEFVIFVTPRKVEKINDAAGALSEFEAMEAAMEVELSKMKSAGEKNIMEGKVPSKTVNLGKRKNKYVR
jgi:Flp pilus assembly secretin CpaC